MSRRAKIAATLGPSCDEEETLRAMLQSGLDVARLNFSHGSAEEHEKRVSRLRRAGRRLGREVALLADLQGPRFRVGRLDGGELELVAGESVELVAGRNRSRPGTIPVAYRALADDLRRGDPVLMDDGKLALRVERVRGGRARCVVERGGTLTDRKGINLPDTRLSVPTLTAKDRRDLRTAVELDSDWLALSFVRSGDDVRQARRLLRRLGAESLPVLAKIERAEAIERLEEILEAADGLLVARGDLGVELPPARVPLLQKEMIELANAAGKPAMTATQMLDSMRHSLRPTRAEASDVANAVLDGSGCLLLTAETAVGRYPAQAVAMMADIIEQAERSGRTHVAPAPAGELSVALSTCRAGARAARDAGARCLAVFTHSGFSAQQAARFRPSVPILAFTPSLQVLRKLRLVWGVRPRRVRACRTVEAMLRVVDEALLSENPGARGAVVVVLAGSPIGVTGTTNLMKLHRLGG